MTRIGQPGKIVQIPDPVEVPDYVPAPELEPQSEPAPAQPGDVAMTLDEARKSEGCKVVYRPPHAPDKPEEGVITSTNESYAFVRYGSDAGSRATLPEQLELIAPGGAAEPQRSEPVSDPV